MQRKGLHRRPKAVRLLIATAGALLVAGAAIGMGAAAAHPPNDSTATSTSSSTSSGSSGGGQDAGAGNSDGTHQDVGPFAKDFVDITKVTPNVQQAQQKNNASTGTFVSDCGVNQEGHHNPDNFIVAPGVRDGAQHVHDYVGNDSTNGDSTDDSLAAAGTTCKNQGDKSAYFWPVLRVLGQNDVDANAQGGGKDGNLGKIQQAQSAKLEFRGSPAGKVTAMPQFLRILFGDAKAASNGGGNGKPAWTCTGFEDRLTNKYPLCPKGAQVERIHDFPNCWDGKNTDSEDHRSHIVDPQDDGSCPQGFTAVPQLRVTLTYNVPQNTKFAVDTFPEEEHNPLTDHDDFENVMSNNLMKQIVTCINNNQRCQ